MELKTIDAVELYKILISAKLPKMDDNGHIKLIRLCNHLKSLVIPVQEFERDAKQKLKDDLFDNMLAAAKQLSNKTELTPEEKEERAAIDNYFNDYVKSVNECLKPELEKVHSICFDGLNDEAFEQFISGNEFTVAEAATLSEFLLA